MTVCYASDQPIRALHRAAFAEFRQLSFGWRQGLKIANRLVVPTTNAKDENRRPGTVLLDVSSKFGRRDCAEPRALQLAASHGQRLTGMTTIWFGDIRGNPILDEHEFADTRDFQPAEVAFNAALPCEWCKANEARIMIRVADAIAMQNPARPNLQRRHSISEFHY